MIRLSPALRVPLAVVAPLSFALAASIAPPPVRAAGSAPVPWSQIDGRPQWRKGMPVGCYIFRLGNEVHVVTHGQGRTGFQFAGRIVVDGGTITTPKPIRLEAVHHDAFKQETPNVLDFRFLTYGAFDGVSFNVNGGKSVAFAITIQGQRTNRIFVGPKTVEFFGDPVVVDLTR